MIRNKIIIGTYENYKSKWENVENYKSKWENVENK